MDVHELRGLAEQQAAGAVGSAGEMNLDTKGPIADKPEDFLLKRNSVPGFDYTKTNDTIRHAGASRPVIRIPPVPRTLPTYSYAHDEY